MKLIVGLGNPDKQYENTRHNIGFLALDELVKQNSTLSFLEKENFLGLVAEGHDIKLLKPTTYMNKSGEAIRRISNYYHLNPENIIVVHDDLDLPFGQLKIQKGKSAAGHKGAASTIDYLETSEFWRIRVGMAGKTKGKMPGDKYVLSKFIPSEERQLPSLLKKIAEAIKHCIEDGPEAAAQKYNKKNYTL